MSALGSFSVNSMRVKSDRFNTQNLPLTLLYRLSSVHHNKHTCAWTYSHADMVCISRHAHSDTCLTHTYPSSWSASVDLDSFIKPFAYCSSRAALQGTREMAQGQFPCSGNPLKCAQPPSMGSSVERQKCVALSKTFPEIFWWLAELGIAMHEATFLVCLGVVLKSRAIL